MKGEREMGKKLWHAAKSVGLNVALWWCMWAGLHGAGWAWNVFRFGAWIVAFTCIMAPSMAKNDPIFAETLATSITPGWLAASFDLSEAIILAAFGHFFFAAMMFISFVGEALARDVAKKAAAAKHSPEAAHAHE